MTKKMHTVKMKTTSKSDTFKPSNAIKLSNLESDFGQKELNIQRGTGVHKSKKRDLQIPRKAKYNNIAY